MKNSCWLERSKGTKNHFRGKMHYAVWLLLTLSLLLLLVSAIIPLDLFVGNKELAGDALWLLWLYTLLLLVLCLPFELAEHTL